MRRATPWEWFLAIVEPTYTEVTLGFCSTFFPTYSAIVRGRTTCDLILSWRHHSVFEHCRIWSHTLYHH
ncbi:hypothetical protein ERO13_D01G164433v2 [Gossypium hirsutum]|uniref:Uncharacterized protein n=4 Tax=Gossypium TaxID=3633 RepID=A0A5J5SQJ7_GOSBA|nr:hypothetical protein ES319_D01G198100v1 [Gossypium barbadense]KAG4163310.1 hypothetical protein ERO13_D01G164433v2 [Gossypium hirsutum]TYG83981.1 hypothetical protein ES288_D01G212900v1 [Gossypium darwinii]TYH88814.1 hypothetical protein ES332_D01G214800v1 [Gossypium tomentosum]TYI98297.1 hypothetical protein E1A91_D01G204200v1 [Gossypium mustelinum]